LWVFGNKGEDASDIWLQSPAWGQRVDAKLGPTPKILAVDQVFGDEPNTFSFVFSVETFLVDTDGQGVKQTDALISNRFSQRHQFSTDGYLTIVTQGKALFRTDLIYSMGVNPDSRRQILFMPIPPVGFVRENVVVEGIPDSTGVEYAYEDRQVPFNFPAAPYIRAASIMINHRQAIVTDTDVLEGALSAYERNLNMKWLQGQGTKTPNPKAASAILNYGKP
jgi:hypothetical protein